MGSLLFLNFGTFEWMIFIPLLLAYPLLLMYCLVDIARSDFRDFGTKLLWLLIIVFAPFLGSLLYLKVGKSNKAAQV
jgi:hypothetical protein